MKKIPLGRSHGLVIQALQAPSFLRCGLIAGALFIGCPGLMKAQATSPSFGGTQGSLLANGQIRTPYMQALELESSLERVLLLAKAPAITKESLTVDSNVATPMGQSTHSFSFEVKNLWPLKTSKEMDNGIKWVIGSWEGSVSGKVTHYWGGNGNRYKGTISGTVRWKNEISMSVQSPYQEFAGGARRIKIETGVKAEVTPSASASLFLDFRRPKNSAKYSTAHATVGGGIKAGFAFITPKLSFERYDPGLGWSHIPLYKTREGGWSANDYGFELNVGGSADGYCGYYWEIWDNDPDKDNDAEQNNWDLSGKAGVDVKLEVKFSKKVYANYSWSGSWSLGNKKFTIWQGVDDGTDKEFGDP